VGEKVKRYSLTMKELEILSNLHIYCESVFRFPLVLG
jgi:hypothetical protein